MRRVVLIDSWTYCCVNCPSAARERGGFTQPSGLATDGKCPFAADSEVSLSASAFLM